MPIPYRELRSSVIDLMVERAIDPTGGALPDTFKRLNEEYGEVYREAETAFDVAARKEISQDDFGLEPLGLATWHVTLQEETLDNSTPSLKRKPRPFCVQRRESWQPSTFCPPPTLPSPGNGRPTAGFRTTIRRGLSRDSNGMGTIYRTICVPTES